MQHPSTFALILLGFAILIGSQFGHDSAVASNNPQALPAAVAASTNSENSEATITLDEKEPAEAGFFANSSGSPDSQDIGAEMNSSSTD